MKKLLFIFILTGRVFAQDSTINCYTGSIHPDVHTKYFSAKLWSTGDDSLRLSGWQDEVTLGIDFDEGVSTIDTASNDTLLWTITLAEKPALTPLTYVIDYPFTFTNLTFFLQTYFGVEAESDESWAIYHDSMMHDWYYRDGTSDIYHNGKFCNFRRAILRESDDDTVTIDSMLFDTAAGTFSLYIDSVQLDTADYPVELEVRINTTFDPVSSQYNTTYWQSLLCEHLDSMHSGYYTLSSVYAWLSTSAAYESSALCMAVYDTLYDAEGSAPLYPDQLIDSTGAMDITHKGKQLFEYDLINDSCFPIGLGGHIALVIDFKGESKWGFYNDGDYGADTIIRGGWFTGDLPGVDVCPVTVDRGEDDYGVYEEKFGWAFCKFIQGAGALEATNTATTGVTIAQ